MSIFIVDVEADGPCPCLYSMVQLGAVVYGKHNDPDHGFYGELRPIGLYYSDEALESFNITRNETLTYPDAHYAIDDFLAWVLKHNTGSYRPVLFQIIPALIGSLSITIFIYSINTILLDIPQGELGIFIRD